MDSVRPPSKRIRLDSTPTPPPETQRSSAAPKPLLEEDSCSICLQQVVDRTVIPTCSHEFCYECLLVWSGPYTGILDLEQPYLTTPLLTPSAIPEMSSMFAAARGSCHPPHPVETRLSETLPATIANVPTSGAAPQSNSSGYQACGARMGTAREARKTRKRGSRSSGSCHRAKKMDLPTSFVCQGPPVLISFTSLAPAAYPRPPVACRIQFVHTIQTMSVSIAVLRFSRSDEPYDHLSAKGIACMGQSRCRGALLSLRIRGRSHSF